MTREFISVLIDQSPLTLNEMVVSCNVSREWIIEHVEAGVLLFEKDNQPDQWRFSSQDVLRARRMWDLERQFDANPELAGLVADLFEEIERLRARIRRDETGK